MNSNLNRLPSIDHDYDTEDFDSDDVSSVKDSGETGAIVRNENDAVLTQSSSLHDVLFAGMENIAAACDAVNAENRKQNRSEEERRAERRLANRRSAKMSRDRKKVESDELQQKAARLAEENQMLSNENKDLKRQILLLLEKHESVLQTDKLVGLGGQVIRRTIPPAFLAAQLLHHRNPTLVESTNLPQGQLSLESSFGLPNMMQTPNAALSQATQLSQGSLQVVPTGLSMHNARGAVEPPVDVSGTSLDFSSRDTEYELEGNKRRKTRSHEFTPSPPE